MNTFLATLPRVALLMIALTGPALAMHAAGGSDGSIIENSAKHNSGAGFVLMMSLQRA